MKTKINYRSKKAITIIAIIAVLILVASIGTVAYIKGNRRAAAATEEIATEEEGTTTTQTADETVSDSDLPLLGDTEENNDNNGDNVSDATAVATNNNNNNTANATNQTYTQTTIKIIENPWETSETAWSQITKSASLGASIDGLDANKPNLEIKKSASNTAVQIGETITYVIEVKNLSEIDVKNIYVYDTVPKGTELIEDPSKTELSWKINIPAGEKVDISFKVKVVSLEEAGIKNIATVNGEDTNPTETAIINSNKVATVIDKDGNAVDRETAKVGEKIRYTITANNVTSVNGKTTIIDTVPEGTELVNGSISPDAKVTVKDGVTTITWEEIDVKENSETSVSFDVTVKDVSESINNVAIIGSTETKETETKVANIKTVKTSSADGKTIHENDEITYTLTLTNSGNAEGTVEVSDIVPEYTTLVDKGTATTSVDEETRRTKLTWNVTVPVGEPITVTFKVRVNPFTESEITIVNDKVEQDGTPVDTKTEDKVEKEYFSIKVNKEFEDFENIDSVRPSAVTIALYSNESNTAVATYKLKASENWEHTFTGLNKYGLESKELLTYRVEEVSMEGAKAEYIPSVSPETVTVRENTANITVTNTLKPETVKTNITVKKEWKYSETSDPKIPDSIDIVITGNGNIEKKLDKSAGWEGTFELSKYNTEGNEINYAVTEKNVSKYVEISNTKSNNTITIVNALPSVNVVKEIVSINGDTSNTQRAVAEGDVIGYKITVTNGLVELKNVQVKDEMTNGKTVYSKYEEGVVSEAISDDIVDTIEVLAANEKKTYLVYYQVDSGDVKNLETNATVTNTAYAEAKYIDNKGDDQEADSSYSEISVQIEDKPELSISKTSNKSNIKVVPGDVITYTITVSNTGNTKQKNVIVTDTMNGERVAIIDTTVVVTNEANEQRSVTAEVKNGTISIGDLEVGEIATITATYTVTENDMSAEENTIGNKANVKSDTPETTEKEDNADVITKSWIADITLNKESEANNATVKYGDKITYILSATNNGTAPGTAILKDTDLQALISSDKISSTIENIVVKDFDKDGNARTDSSKTSQDIINGIEVYVPEKENDVAKIATVTFTVTVTARPGEEIKNSLTTDEDNEPTVISKVEKDVTVKKITSTPVVTNSNVVIVLDISGSMNDKMPNSNKTRLTAAKDACAQLINGMFKEADSECQVSVVTFSAEEDYEWWDLLQLFGKGTDNARCIGTATNSTEAGELKNKVNNLQAYGGTRIAAGLNVAQTEIENLNNKNPNNKNIVVVLSDGTFNISDDGDTLESSAGEKKSRVSQYAQSLKSSSSKPTVYSIPFGSGETTIMRDIIASDEKTYMPSSDSYEDLIKVFRTIAEDIQDVTLTKTTTNGKIYLTGIDITKEVEIKIKNSDGTLLNTIKDIEPNIEQIDSDENGYYLDLAKFGAQYVVEITYTAE